MTVMDVEINDFTSLLVKNTGTIGVMFQWGRQVFGVDPGEEKFVLANAVFNMLGDPRSGDVPKVDRATRAEEWKRVAARFGLDVLDLNQRLLNEERTPHIEVYTPDGTRLYTVLEDPTGEHVRTVSQTAAGHDALMARIDQLQAELASLTRMVTPAEPEDITEEPTPKRSKYNPLDVPEDDE